MRTVDDVVARMRAIASGVPHGDGVGVFNGVYLQVTELIRDRLGAGSFADAAFMERLDVAFAGMFFTTVDAASAGAEVPPAWAPLVEARRRPGLEPVQFALAGMNAHINHDLAVAVATTCERDRRVPAAVHGDYELVNDLLATVVRPIRQSFLDKWVVDAGAPLTPLADLVSAWSIDAAREAAWVHASALWELRHSAPLAQAYRHTLARTVGLVGRQLLVAFGAPDAASSERAR